ncbi:hypothetical protein SSPSH_003646 [Salinisphaera shabanensis E1L3A]|uniref:Uncharacterized protein n=1 Tax=Salinisphaera shabanensis E1L3A TaxID=1033802 RepID=U2E0U8_9GAMM|nr:hypothetical protein [Salinisphaera shabanensis]ERJ17541.1 hypothetical protein SSPSH_003646 [Salinisphaera shabanensis E1L3A]
MSSLVDCRLALIGRVEELSRAFAHLVKRCESEIAETEEFLTSFYTPVVSLLLSASDSVAGAPVPKSLRELASQRKAVNYSTDQVKVLIADSQLDYVQSNEPNRYEWLVQKILGLNASSIEFGKTDYELIETDTQLREKLKANCSAERNSIELESLIDGIPTSCLEGLNTNRYAYLSRYQSPLVLLLDARVSLDEDYLYYVCSSKCGGATVIGQPHGAYYVQTKLPSAFEATEQLLSDKFVEPDWGGNVSADGALPNLRASKNKFLSGKNRLLRPRRKCCSVLFVFPLLRNADNRLLDRFSIPTAINQIVRRLSPGDPLPGAITLKFHPLESGDAVEAIIAAVSAVLPCEVEDGSGLELKSVMPRYRDIIFMSPFMTAMLEIGVLGKRFLVLVPSPPSLDEKYLRFLRHRSEKSYLVELKHGETSEVFKMNSSAISKAYRASWFYPMLWARHVRKIINSRA